MGTQGLLAITENGKTIVKVIVGCNGFNLADLVTQLKEEKPSSIHEIYKMAIEHHFGCPTCLVVMDEENSVGEDIENLHPRYRETFGNPKFNPRWAFGTAQYYEIVEITQKGTKQ